MHSPFVKCNLNSKLLRWKTIAVDSMAPSMVPVTMFYICSLPQTQRKTIPVFLKPTYSNLMRLPGKPSNTIDFRSLLVGAHIIRLIADRCKILLKNSKLHKLYPKDVISRMMDVH